MKPKIDYTLYLVTDSKLMRAKSVEASVEAAIKGGVTLVQLREKELSARDFYERSLAVKRVTDHYHVPLIINDRVDIALAADAAGVHLGQSDLPADAARRLLGPDKIIGVSAHNLREADAAVRMGADYLGVGAMFATQTKGDAGLTPADDALRIKSAAGIPVVIIGGINETNLQTFAHTGIDGAAVVSAIVARDDIEAAARRLKDAATLLRQNA